MPMAPVDNAAEQAVRWCACKLVEYLTRLLCEAFPCLPMRSAHLPIS
jgi:hypothetical protein